MCRKVYTPAELLYHKLTSFWMFFKDGLLYGWYKEYSLLPKLMIDKAYYMIYVVMLFFYLSSLMEILDSIYVPKMNKLIELSAS